MRIWIGRAILIGVWILATHGALDMLDRVAIPTGTLGALAFAGVSAGMIWLAVHLGDVPFWDAVGSRTTREEP